MLQTFFTRQKFLFALTIGCFSLLLFAPKISAVDCYEISAATDGTVTSTQLTDRCPKNSSSVTDSNECAAILCQPNDKITCCSKFGNSTQASKQASTYQACIDAIAKSDTNAIKEQCQTYLTQSSAPGETDSKDPCYNISNVSAKNTCRKCMYNNAYPSEADLKKKPVGFWTGIGCLSTNPLGAIAQLTFFGLGIASVFIFFQILIGAFTMLTSRGNPKGVQDAKERITNSVIALLLIIFSVTILQFIGVSVLQIPGFFSN